jgi:hypothetical protein
MGLSNAERQRKFRLRRDADEARRREYLQKSKLKYKKDLIEGKRKRIKDMSEREKRSMRKIWRNQKRVRKERLKALNNQQPTPPPSPAESESDDEGVRKQNKQSEKKRQRARAKCYRDIKQKDREIQILKQKVEMYKKRWIRAKYKSGAKDSPRTHTRNLLKAASVHYKSPEFGKIKRKLFENCVIIQQLKNKYKSARKGQKGKLSELLSGSVLAKYRLRSAFNDKLGIGVARRRRKEKIYLSNRVRQTVAGFFLRPDNSTLLAGIKKTKTFQKHKRQKRVLKDTIKNLHVKFLAEANNVKKISLSLFSRLRPYWVTFPVESERETCLCVLCDNTKMLLNEITNVTTLKKGITIEEVMTQSVR